MMSWLIPETHVSTAQWIGLAVGAFVLFRFFDIVKPGVINRSQGVSGGRGVLMDDILAGMIAGGLVLIAGIFIQQM